jgi:hypothetical protein
VSGAQPSGRASRFIVLGVVFWATDVSTRHHGRDDTRLLMIAGVPGSVAWPGSPRILDLVAVLFFGYAWTRRLPGASLRILLPSRRRGHPRGLPAHRVRAHARHPVDDGSHGILMPIAWALVQALGLPLPGAGRRSSS